MFNMVGQLSTEVREARDRVRTALKNSGFDLPYGRITVNFSPADRHKSGTGFDLAIAISLLKAMGCIGFNENEFMFIGELALDGSILKVNGIDLLYWKSQRDAEVDFLINTNNDGIIPIEVKSEEIIPNQKA